MQAANAILPGTDTVLTVSDTGSSFASLPIIHAGNGRSMVMVTSPLPLPTGALGAVGDPASLQPFLFSAEGGSAHSLLSVVTDTTGVISGGSSEDLLKRCAPETAASLRDPLPLPLPSGGNDEVSVTITPKAAVRGPSAPQKALSSKRLSTLRRYGASEGSPVQGAARSASSARPLPSAPLRPLPLNPSPPLREVSRVFAQMTFVMVYAAWAVCASIFGGAAGYTLTDNGSSIVALCAGSGSGSSSLSSPLPALSAWGRAFAVTGILSAVLLASALLSAQVRKACKQASPSHPSSSSSSSADPNNSSFLVTLAVPLACYAALAAELCIGSALLSRAVQATGASSCASGEAVIDSALLAVVVSWCLFPITLLCLPSLLGIRLLDHIPLAASSASSTSSFALCACSCSCRRGKGKRRNKPTSRVPPSTSLPQPLSREANPSSSSSSSSSSSAGARPPLTRKRSMSAPAAPELFGDKAAAPISTWRRIAFAIAPPHHRRGKSAAQRAFAASKGTAVSRRTHKSRWGSQVGSVGTAMTPPPLFSPFAKGTDPDMPRTSSSNFVYFAPKPAGTTAGGSRWRKGGGEGGTAKGKGSRKGKHAKLSSVPESELRAALSSFMGRVHTGIDSDDDAAFHRRDANNSSFVSSASSSSSTTAGAADEHRSLTGRDRASRTQSLVSSIGSTVRHAVRLSAATVVSAVSALSDLATGGVGAAGDGKRAQSHARRGSAPPSFAGIGNDADDLTTSTASSGRSSASISPASSPTSAGAATAAAAVTEPATPSSFIRRTRVFMSSPLANASRPSAKPSRRGLNSVQILEGGDYSGLDLLSDEGEASAGQGQGQRAGGGGGGVGLEVHSEVVDVHEGDFTFSSASSTSSTARGGLNDSRFSRSGAESVSWRADTAGTAALGGLDEGEGVETDDTVLRLTFPAAAVAGGVASSPARPSRSLSAQKRNDHVAVVVGVAAGSGGSGGGSASPSLSDRTATPSLSDRTATREED